MTMGDNNWLADLLPLGTILIVVMMQIYFWFPIDHSRTKESEPKKVDDTLSSSVVKDEQIAVERTGSSTQDKLSENSEIETRPDADTPASNNSINTNVENSTKTETSNMDSSNAKKKNDDDIDEEDLFAMNDNSDWRCACEGGFLPPGMLKTFGSAESMMRLGTGQCYHKQM